MLCDLFHQNSCPHTYRQPPHNKHRTTHHRYRRQGYDVVSGAALGVLVPGSPTGRGAALVPPESRPALLGATGSRPHDLRGDTGASQLPRVRATISPHTQHHPQLLYHLLTLEAGTTWEMCRVPRMLTDLIILAEFVNERKFSICPWEEYFLTDFE